MFKQTTHWLIIGLLFLMVTLNATAQTFTVKPTSLNVAEGEKFTVTWEIKGGPMDDFQAPDLSKFYIMSGPNESHSMQWVNGRTTNSHSVSYVLSPKKMGKYIIPAATVTSKRKAIRSGKVTVKVGKGSAAAARKNQKQAKPPRRTTPRNVPPTKQGQAQQQPTKQTTPDVWLGLVVDTTNVYQGQQLTAIYRLYTNVDVTNYQIENPPSFTGYWVQDITPQQRQTPGTEVIDSVIFRTLDLKKYALFPQRTGSLEIDPMDIKVDARIPRPGTSNSPWGQRYIAKKLDIKNKPLPINVFPLPEAGKPSSFTGAVGKFTISSSVSNPNIKANESIDYNVSITGSGNIKLIDLPPINFPKSFQTFDPVVSEDVYTKQDVVNGRKKFEYTIIPSEPGKHQLPSIAFSYFDIETGKYKTINSPAATINVAKGDGTFTDVSIEDNADIYPLKSSLSLSRRSSSFLFSIPFWLLLLLPFGIFPYVYLKIKERQAVLSDVVGMKRNRAAEIARQRLTTAKTYMEANNKKPFYDEVIHVIWGYLGDKLNMPNSELSKENIAAMLTKNGVSDGNIEQLTKTITYCEMAVYAPVKDADNLQGTYDTTINLIANIEEEMDAFANPDVVTVEAEEVEGDGGKPTINIG